MLKAFVDFEYKFYLDLNAHFHSRKISTDRKFSENIIPRAKFRLVVIKAVFQQAEFFARSGM
jgi:hypothetical protein